MGAVVVVFKTGNVAEFDNILNLSISEGFVMVTTGADVLHCFNNDLVAEVIHDGATTDSEPLLERSYVTQSATDAYAHCGCSFHGDHAGCSADCVTLGCRDEPSGTP